MPPKLSTYFGLANSRMWRRFNSALTPLNSIAGRSTWCPKVRALSHCHFSGGCEEREKNVLLHWGKGRETGGCGKATTSANRGDRHSSITKCFSSFSTCPSPDLYIVNYRAILVVCNKFPIDFRCGANSDISLFLSEIKLSHARTQCKYLAHSGPICCWLHLEIEIFLTFMVLISIQDNLIFLVEKC